MSDKFLCNDEKVAHEQLFEMLSVLQHSYPMNKDLEKLFRCDMFVRSNKPAFQELFFYLLSILNPKEAKAKLKNYPPHDARGELQYRNEVMAYVNQLNSIYPDANIPKIMTSHLITPGGFRFIMFALKMCQLVLREHLCRTADNPHKILARVKPGKSGTNNESILRRIKGLTDKINAEIRNDLENDFPKKLSEYVLEAQGISEKLKEVQILLKNGAESVGNAVLLKENLETEVKDIDRRVKDVETMQRQFTICSNLINSICNSENILQFESSEKKQEFNLTDHFKVVAKFIESIILDGKLCSDSIQEKVLEYKKAKCALENLSIQSDKLINDVKTFIKKINNN